MKINDLHPSKYLKVTDLEGDQVFTIAKVSFETLKDNDGNEEDKPVLWFLGVQKGLVLNPTNRKRILAQHPAEDTDEWIGKQITLTQEWVEAFGKADFAIRVKVMPPQRKPVSNPATVVKSAHPASDDPNWDAATPASSMPY